MGYGKYETQFCGMVAGEGADRTANTAIMKAILACSANEDVFIHHSGGDIWFNEGFDLSTYNLIGLASDIGASFVWDCPNGGLHIGYNDIRKCPRVMNLSFLTTATANAGTGIKLTGPVLPSATHSGPLVDNVNVSGLDESISFWDTQLHIENAWYPMVRNYRGKGKDTILAPFAAQYGIRATNCQAFMARDWKVFHTENAYFGDGNIHGEGLNISGGEIVGCNNGIVHTPGIYKPCISIHDMHINTYKRGIVVKNAGQMKLHDIHLYKTQLSSDYWRGVDLFNCHGWHAHHIFGATPGCTTNGADLFFVDQCKDMEISQLGTSDWVGPGCQLLIGSNNDNIRLSQVMIMENAPQVTPYAIVGTGNTHIIVN